MPAGTRMSAGKRIPAGRRVPAALRWCTSWRALRVFSIAGVVANVVIVLTGGAVRLTASGLGCPTWPRCTEGSLVRTSQTGGHGLIEFTNRTLTFALFIVAVATVTAAIGQRRHIRLASLALAGIPAQAVLGGISVLTHLNPWVVGAHLLLSMAIIAVTVVLASRVQGDQRVRADQRVVTQPAPATSALATSALATSTPATSTQRSDPLRPSAALMLGRLLVGFTAVVLAVGTAVTGAGPHAGAADTDGRVHRNGLAPASVSQLHADVVMILIGLTIGMWLLLRATGAPRREQRAAALLLATELSQGLIGYVQYFAHVPAQLVELHLFGACLVWVAVLHLYLQLALSPRVAPRSQQLGDRVDHQPDERAHDRAVDADELQIASHLDLESAARFRGVPARNRG